MLLHSAAAVPSLVDALLLAFWSLLSATSSAFTTDVAALDAAADRSMPCGGVADVTAGDKLLGVATGVPAGEARARAVAKIFASDDASIDWFSTDVFAELVTDDDGDVIMKSGELCGRLLLATDGVKTGRGVVGVLTTLDVGAMTSGVEMLSGSGRLANGAALRFSGDDVDLTALSDGEARTSLRLLSPTLDVEGTNRLSESMCLNAGIFSSFIGFSGAKASELVLRIGLGSTGRLPGYVGVSSMYFVLLPVSILCR